MTPRTNLLLAVGLATVPIVAGIWTPGLTTIGLAANLLILVIAAVDLLVTPAPAAVEIARDVSEVLSVGTRNPVTLRILNRSRMDIDLEVTDEVPVPSETEGLPLSVHLTPWKESSST